MSFLTVKNLGTAKAYLFRVLSHSATTYTASKAKVYKMPGHVKRRAVTAGLIGGILFFIVAIVLSVCTVKICNKRRRRKQERGESILNFPILAFRYSLKKIRANVEKKTHEEKKLSLVAKTKLYLFLVSIKFGEYKKSRSLSLPCLCLYNKRHVSRLPL